MIRMEEMDRSVTLAQQIEESGGPVLLVNRFDVDAADVDEFLAAWADDAAYFKRQPGYISAQLHRGTGGSCVFLNVAVWESVDLFRQAFASPEFRAKLVEIFGNEGSRERSENDIFLLLNSSHANSYPYFYLSCGTEDSFLDTNRAFVLQLASRKIAYEYHETPGGHTWDYWDGALQPMLEAARRVLSASHPE